MMMTTATTAQDAATMATVLSEEEKQRSKFKHIIQRHYYEQRIRSIWGKKEIDVKQQHMRTALLQHLSD